MNSIVSWNQSRVAALCGLCAALAGDPASAADRHWANVGTDFNDGANWTGGVAPGTGDRGFFSTALVAQPRVTASRTLFGVYFTPALGTAAGSATAACGGYVLGGEPGAALALTASGYNYNGVYMMEQCTVGTNVLAVPLVFPEKTTESHHMVNVVSGTLEFAGPLTGNSNNILRVGGPAKFPAFVLSGDNSGFTGGFTKAGGYPMTIGNSEALSRITRLELSVHGAQAAESNRLVNTSGGPLVFENNPRIILNGGDTHYLISDHPIDFGDGTVTFSDANAGRSAPLAIYAPLLRIGGPAIQTGAANGYRKFGPGTLEIGGASSYTGDTMVFDGVFLARHRESVSPLSALNIARHSASVSGGILGLGYGDFTNALGTAAGCFYSQNTGGYNNWGGWAAYGADRSVNVGNNLQPVTNVAPFFANLTLGSATADATVTFLNPIHTGSTTFYAFDGTADIDGRIAGAITNYNTATPTLAKRGDGTLELAADNPVTGTFNLYEGRLLLSGALRTTVNVKAAAKLAGDGTLWKPLVVEAGGVLSMDNRLGTLTLHDNLTLNDGAALEIVLDGSNATGMACPGAGKTLRNLGAVNCTVVAANRDVASATMVLLDWSGASSPNVSGLDASRFAVANPEEFSATFAVVDSTLVMDYRNLAAKPTTVLVR